MKRNNNSIRSKKWFKRNSLNNTFCQEYVSKLCKVQFGIANFNFGIVENQQTSLLISYGFYSYKIYADQEDVCLKVYEKRIIDQKEHYSLSDKIFFGDNCWYHCLYFIKNRI